MFEVTFLTWKYDLRRDLKIQCIQQQQLNNNIVKLGNLIVLNRITDEELFWCSSPELFFFFTYLNSSLFGAPNVRHMMTFHPYKCPDSTPWVSHPVGYITQGLDQQWSTVFRGSSCRLWMDTTFQTQTLASHMGWTGHYSHNKTALGTDM